MMFRSFASRLAVALGAAGLVTGMALISTARALAAVPDKWGFAFVNTPGVAGTPDPNHQAGSWPAPMQATSNPGDPGQVIVRFPNLATAAQGGVVHVTAVDKRAAWCQAQKWVPKGQDELVYVRCFKAGGFPTFSPYTVLFTVSTSGSVPAGQAYGYVHYEPGSGVVTSFNSSGGATTVAPLSDGVWKVTMAGLGSGVQVGGIQVTAVNKSAPAKCNLDQWTWTKASQVFVVRCFNAGSSPFKTGWTLSYQRARAITGKQQPQFAYTFDNKSLLIGPYAPTPPGINFNSLFGLNTISSAGTGLRTVQFPKVGTLPNTVLVTPFHAGPGFCNLQSPWKTAVPDVLVRVSCFNAAGTHESHASMVTYTAAHTAH